MQPTSFLIDLRRDGEGTGWSRWKCLPACLLPVHWDTDLGPGPEVGFETPGGLLPGGSSVTWTCQQPFPRFLLVSGSDSGKSSSQTEGCLLVLEVQCVTKLAKRCC